MLPDEGATTVQDRHGLLAKLCSLWMSTFRKSLDIFFTIAQDGHIENTAPAE